MLALPRSAMFMAEAQLIRRPANEGGLSLGGQGEASCVYRLQEVWGGGSVSKTYDVLSCLSETGLLRQRITMRVTRVPTSTLRFADYNPRKIGDGEMAALKRSIERFGFVDPVIVNRREGKDWLERADVIVGGHQRVRAARELGLKTVPVVYVDLSPDEEKLLNLALNKIGGVFDMQKLSALLGDLRAAQIDLEGSGFSQKEISRAIVEAERQLSANLPAEEDAAPSLPKTPRTKPGEMVTLGRHRLMCGDSTRADDLGRLMGGEKAAMLWTDPPYGVTYAGKTAASMTIKNDCPSGVEELLKTALSVVDGVLQPGCPIYVAHPAGPLELPFLNAFVATGWSLRQTLVWVKDAMVPGHMDYHYKHECVQYGFKPGPGRLGRGRQGWFGGQDQTSVIEVPRPKTSREHPTSKPVALVEACLRNSSVRDALVLDPFAGSGSTLIACQRLGRRAFLMEIDPRYCDVIRERWRRFTGQREARRGRNQVA
jgi:DNA modification methylase